MSDDWNNLVANQTSRTLWFFADSDPEEIRRERHAAVDALMGIKPGDELEGMIAAQLIACHNASMECYRRAMIRDQTHAPGATMPGADAPRQPVPVACDEKRSLPDARGAVAGRTER
jgi:hypothetical protein